MIYTIFHRHPPLELVINHQLLVIYCNYNDSQCFLEHRSYRSLTSIHLRLCLTTVTSVMKTCNLSFINEI